MRVARDTFRQEGIRYEYAAVMRDADMPRYVAVIFTLLPRYYATPRLYFAACRFATAMRHIPH